MLAKGYLYGSHFLPHDAMATMNSGKTFLTELGEVGLRNCKVVPRTHDIWIGINRLRQILPRFTFRIPACERGLRRYPTIIPCERPRLAWPWMNLSMTGHVMRRPP